MKKRDKLFLRVDFPITKAKSGSTDFDNHINYFRLKGEI